MARRTRRRCSGALGELAGIPTLYWVVGAAAVGGVLWHRSQQKVAKAVAQGAVKSAESMAQTLAQGSQAMAQQGMINGWR